MVSTTSPHGDGQRGNRPHGGPEACVITRQHVALSTGTAGTASGFTRLTPELRPSAGNSLFAFALPRRPTAVQA